MKPIRSAELAISAGGMCTDCHAGENPYIIHPDSNLGGGVFMGDLDDPPLSLPTFGPNRYDPLVGASWPQNALSHAQPLVPGACVGCHMASMTVAGVQERLMTKLGVPLRVIPVG